MNNRSVLMVTILALLATGVEPGEEFKKVQVERIRTAEELFQITEKLYQTGAVSPLEYQTARLKMLAVKIDAAATPQDRLAAMQERVEACEAKLGYLTRPGLRLDPLEAEALIPLARVERTEAKCALTPTRDDRERLVRETLSTLSKQPLDAKTLRVLSRSEQLEIRLVRLTLQARLLALLRD